MYYTVYYAEFDLLVHSRKTAIALGYDIILNLRTNLLTSQLIPVNGQHDFCIDPLTTSLSRLFL